MSSVWSIQNAFNRGEVSPLLHSRSDVDFWRSSLKECSNFRVLPHGGLVRRSGTRFVVETADSTKKTRLIPFRFSEEQSYVLALNGNGSINFLANRGIVESGGSPYSIAHLWAESALQSISFVGVNDLLYLAHGTASPKTITRIAETNWTIGATPRMDGPWLDLNTTGTSLTPAAYGSPVPSMTSNSTPSGVVSDTGGNVGAFQLFDRVKGIATRYEVAISEGFISYTFAGAPRIVDGYFLEAHVSPASSPLNWKFEGFDGSIWVVLDSRVSETGWGPSEYRFYNFQNDVAYEAYRLNWTGTENTGVIQTIITSMDLHEKASAQVPFNLTASATANINNGVGFTANDVGRLIRLKGSEGHWRWAEITSRTSSTVVKIRLFDQAFVDLSPILQWQLGAFSAQSGWPSVVNLYNERLGYAGASATPVNVYLSKQGKFDDFGVSTPLVSTDAISIAMLSSNMNRINWLVDDVDLITGSAGQVRALGPSDFTSSFSATNITQRKGPRTGAASIQPIEVGGAILYVAAGGRKIRELVLGDQNRYVAPELSLFAEHFFKSGIVEWALSERPDPVVWIVLGDGTLLSLTYDREQKVVAFGRHDLAGGKVESLSVIPSQDEAHDDLYMVVRRTINGVQRRYIEVLEHTFDGDILASEDAFFVDCGATYEGTSITTITGLGHLEGEFVSILADGSEVKGLQVIGGSVILPTPASKVHIGLAYTSRAETLRIAGPAQDGVLFGRKVNNISGHIDVLHTGSVMVGAIGGSNTLYEQIHKEGGFLFGHAPELRTGFVRCEIEGSWLEGEGGIAFECIAPLPCLVRSFVFQTESEP